MIQKLKFLKITNQNSYKKIHISNIVSETIKKSSKLIEKVKPDLVIILGDRYEIFSVCIAAHLQNVLIAHLHGGELTHGAIDDALDIQLQKWLIYILFQIKNIKCGLFNWEKIQKAFLILEQ